MAGITESQLNTLFELIRSEPDQIIFKRLTDLKHSLSNDDLLFKGKFSPTFLTTLSQIFPPPLSLKIKHEGIFRDMFDTLSCRKWVSDESTIFAGNTLVPIESLKQSLGIVDPEILLTNLLTSSLGSKMKPYLLTKPKGLIEVHEGKVFIIFPLHRLDFIIKWMTQINEGAVTFDWLHSNTNEIEYKLVSGTGEIKLNEHNLKLLQSSDPTAEIVLNDTFKRALKIVIHQ